ncbi:MAG: APC family permease [Alphaproteobacteria bacterium]|nr:APC family permease [Alphaproteobacteria bacterium]HPF47611.1 APC family permease [Emcibacteraceae bacterium]HRW29716.1 APC family permease [Emcibacteraceae bacterium]
MNGTENKTDEGLLRAIGTRALGTNIFNLVVGAGIFALPGVVAAKLGPAAIIAYIICAVAISLIFLCYAEIGTRITRSGGSYAYIEEAFGPFAGFIVSMLLWFGWAVLSDAAMTVAMINFITPVVPELEQWPYRILFIALLFTFMVTLNVIGVKSGVRLYVVNTIAKFLPLALLLIVGLFHINFDNLVIREWPDLASIGATTLILIFAFGGAESALNASGEIENPEKTVPRGIFIGISFIFVLYLGLQTVAQGVLGPELANNTDAPLAITAREIFGDWGLKLIVVGSTLSIFSCLCGDMLATPRVIFAAARDGTLPKILARVHPKYKTPYAAIIFYAAAVAGLGLSGTFKPLAVMASGSILIVYLGVCLATIKLRMRDGIPAANEFKMPGKLIIPILACAVIGWMLWQLTLEEAKGLIILIAISVFIYLVQTKLINKAISHKD